jgi:hypothetical protein
MPYPVRISRPAPSGCNIFDIAAVRLVCALGNREFMVEQYEYLTFDIFYQIIILWLQLI